MSTSALSKETLSYTYTTVPTFTNTMVGYSASSTTVLQTPSPGTGLPFNVLSITIANPGVYLCEGNLCYSAIDNGFTPIQCSLSINSAAFNTSNQVSGILDGFNSDIRSNNYIQTTAVITIATTNTILYCVGQSENYQANMTGFIKYTRIA